MRCVCWVRWESRGDGSVCLELFLVKRVWRVDRQVYGNVSRETRWSGRKVNAGDWMNYVDEFMDEIYN